MADSLTIHFPRPSLLRRSLRGISLVWAFADVWRARLMNGTPRHLPILVLMVTDKCNLRCTMCGACDYTPGDHHMLSTEEWKAVIASAATLGTRVVSLTGGEALLRKDLFDIIACARSHGMAVHLNTNGLLLSAKNVTKLRDLGVESVSISLESPEPEIHEAIRGKGTFERTVEGLRRLREGAPEIRAGLNCVVNKHNVKGIHALVDFGAAAGVHQVKFAPIHSNLQHKDKPLDEYGDMVFTEADLPALEEEVHAIENALKHTTVQSTSRHFFAGFTQLYRPPASNFHCYAGYAICVIDAQGNVAACFDKESNHNVRQNPLDVIWRSPAFHQHRQLVRHCDAACWDTTNAELSLRLSLKGLLSAPRQTLRDIHFYLRSGKS